MAIQLTPEQEDRLQAVVSAGVYRSPEAALNAALSVLEAAASPGFEGDEGELEQLLAEGLDSPALSEEEFWNSLDRRTDALYQSSKARET